MHVFESGLARFTADLRIWEYAREKGFSILTADRDFVGLARDRGSPPQVILIDKCSFRNAEIEALIRQNALRIAEFEKSARAMLVLSKIRPTEPRSR